MKIGIIGAENSHSVNIAKALNLEKLIEGFSVDYLWGETEEFAKKTAEAGKIPHIVAETTDMLGKIDALVVDHRHAKYHIAAALPFVEAGVPTFIDKPFCYRAAEGKKLLEIAKKKNTPVTSFSVLPRQQSFLKFKEDIKALGAIKAVTSYGACDIESPYGGIFFYGIHQVEYVLKAFGYDVKAVQITRNGENGTAQLFYADGMIATLNLIKNVPGVFYLGCLAEKGELHRCLEMDKHNHLPGIKAFTHMFKTGEQPEKYEHMLKPVQVLEALEKSVSSGAVEKVEN